MHDRVDDIAKQARQGSVAAIIQTLNEKLADVGIRVRAVLADGVLQLLCEAARQEQLEQSALVAKIRQILEGIAPRNIRRVKINSRIVREQQLLWLEEITRDPENQLLWSEEIVLAKPNLFKQLAVALKSEKRTLPTKKPPLPKVSPRSIHKRSFFWPGLVGGVSLSILLIIIGWLISDWLEPKLNVLNVRIPAQAPNSTAKFSPVPSASSTPVLSPASDPFVEAVRLAEQAAAAGKTVQTSAQWLDVAAKWERASDLMSAVKPEDPRYKTAQDRMKLYRQFSEVAQKQARQKRTP